MPLYQLRKYFEGPLELLATLVIPGVVGGPGGGAAVPRSRPRSPPGQALAGAGPGRPGPGWVGALASLMLRKDARDPAFQRHRREVAEEAIKARALARRGVLPEGGTAVWKNDPDYEARALFKDRCVTCHTAARRRRRRGARLPRLQLAGLAAVVHEGSLRPAVLRRGQEAAAGADEAGRGQRRRAGGAGGVRLQPERGGRRAGGAGGAGPDAVLGHELRRLPRHRRPGGGPGSQPAEARAARTTSAGSSSTRATRCCTASGPRCPASRAS